MTVGQVLLGVALVGGLTCGAIQAWDLVRGRDRRLGAAVAAAAALSMACVLVWGLDARAVTVGCLMVAPAIA